MSDAKGLPKGWVRTSVGDIAKSIQYGHTASATDNSDGPRFLRITDIQDGQVDWRTVPSCDIPKGEISKYRLEAGDIVFARTGATTGKSYLIRNCPEAIFASYLIRLRMNDGVAPSFVHAFFQTSNYWRQIEGGKRGIGQPNVNARVLSKITLPLAPEKHQFRILAKIEELFSNLDAGVAALHRAKANLKRYRAAVLKAAVEGTLTAEWRAKHSNTEPASKLLERILIERRRKWETNHLAKFDAAGKEPPKNWKCKYVEPTPPDTTDVPKLPKEWCWASVEQLVSRSEYGTSIKCDYDSKHEPVLRIPNIAQGVLELSDIKRATQPLRLNAETALQCGDLLMCRTNGSISLIGKTAVVGDDLHTFHAFASYLLRFRFVRLVTLPLFTHHFLSSRIGRTFIESNAASSAGQHNISLSLVHRMPIPLPPDAEQQQIVSKVEERLSVVTAAEQQIENNLVRAVRLRQSVLKQAFDGKLVPHDPNDEPVGIQMAQVKSATGKLKPMRSKLVGSSRR